MNWEMIVAVTGLALMLGQAAGVLFIAGGVYRMVREHERWIDEKGPVIEKLWVDYRVRKEEMKTA